MDKHVVRLEPSGDEQPRRRVAEGVARPSEVVTVDQFTKLADLADEGLERDAWS